MFCWKRLDMFGRPASLQKIFSVRPFYQRFFYVEKLISNETHVFSLNTSSHILSNSANTKEYSKFFLSDRSMFDSPKKSRTSFWMISNLR